FHNATKVQVIRQLYQSNTNPGWDNDEGNVRKRFLDVGIHTYSLVSIKEELLTVGFHVLFSCTSFTYRVGKFNQIDG
ncbi:unnamed protein product, partial [Allacma fusca]